MAAFNDVFTHCLCPLMFIGFVTAMDMCVPIFQGKAANDAGYQLAGVQAHLQNQGLAGW